LPVRLTHWAVALLVSINFFYETGWWHRCYGYIAVCLVLMRLLLGTLNSLKAQPDIADYASRLWWPGFSQIRQHLEALCSVCLKRATHLHAYAGHNPLGQLAAYLMWFLILGLAFTGCLSRTDLLWGEDWPVDCHRWLSIVLQGLVILHICVVIMMSYLQKQNLLIAMLNGKKSKPE